MASNIFRIVPLLGTVKIKLCCGCEEGSTGEVFYLQRLNLQLNLHLQRTI